MIRATVILLMLTIAPCTYSQDTDKSGNNAQPHISYGAELDITSRYVWRGIPYSKGAVLWPSAWVSSRGVTLSIWGNVDLKKPRKLNEYDITLSYERDIKKATLTGSLIWYRYPNQPGVPSTGETTGKIAYPVGKGSLFMSHTFDISEFKGAYYSEYGYSYEHELGPGTTLTADCSISRASAKFVRNYIGVDKGAFLPFSINLSLERKLTSNISIRPHLNINPIIDGEVRRALSRSAAQFGIATSVEF